MQKTELVYETFIRTTPEKLWAAITRPEFARQYWVGNENHSDWKQGSKWTHVRPGKDNEVCVTGNVVESVPPKRLVLTWADPDAPDDGSIVSFDIVPEGDMVSLKVIHNGFKPGSVMAGKVSSGWPRVLSSLKSYLETGKGLNLSCCGG